MNSSETSTTRTKVFISYARRDLDVAIRVREAFIARGFEAFLDTKDIVAGEAWQDRLSGLIEMADAIVFLVSDASAGSQVCAWEIQTAGELEKRILPAMIRDTDFQTLPRSLTSLNFVFLRTEAEFEEGLSRLGDAASIDIAWVREHTRLGELALAWQRNGERPADLLRGESLAAADAWVGSRPADAPEITELQRHYIHSGHEAEVRARKRTRRTLAALATLAVALIAGGVWWVYEQPIREALLWNLKQKPAVKAGKVLTASATGTRFADCGIGCPDMVVVKAGVQQPPGPDTLAELTRPLHLAHTMAVSRTEVTWRDWGMCEEAGACPSVRQPEAETPAFPAHSISWHEARQFTVWLSRRTGATYRLLTDEEWEYLARGGAATRYPWGDNVDTGRANCLWCQPTAKPGAEASILASPEPSRGPMPVASFPANAFGLHDVVGNVAEWVEDAWTENTVRFPNDPRSGGGSAYDKNRLCRIVRGGSWNALEDDVQLGTRGFNAESGRSATIGFRVAREIKTP